MSIQRGCCGTGKVSLSPSHPKVRHRWHSQKWNTGRFPPKYSVFAKLWGWNKTGHIWEMWGKLLALPEFSQYWKISHSSLLRMGGNILKWTKNHLRQPKSMRGVTGWDANLFIAVEVEVPATLIRVASVTRGPEKTNYCHTWMKTRSDRCDGPYCICSSLPRWPCPWFQLSKLKLKRGCCHKKQNTELESSMLVDEDTEAGVFRSKNPRINDVFLVTQLAYINLFFRCLNSAFFSEFSKLFHWSLANKLQILQESLTLQKQPQYLMHWEWGSLSTFSKNLLQSMFPVPAHWWGAARHACWTDYHNSRQKITQPDKSKSLMVSLQKKLKIENRIDRISWRSKRLSKCSKIISEVSNS